jgi:hypothetical protein
VLLVLLQILLLGFGATLFMDLWSWIQRNILKIPTLNYALVARWVLYMPQGKFKHSPIMKSNPMRGERILGWFLHYFIGVVFAAGLIVLVGRTWFSEPSISLGLLTGIITLVFPFFIIQPCLGLGVAASKTPTPWKARTLSLLTHSSYGLGLYITASIIKVMT